MLDKFILKKKQKNNYTKISNEFLQDTNLSFEARGMAASLLSRPEDWVINVSALMAEGNIGRDKVKKIIQELVDNGYMYKAQDRSSGGKFGKNILYISDEKDFLKEEAEKIEQGYEETEEKCYSQPLTEKPLTVSPLTVNPQLQRKEYNKEKNIQKNHDNHDSDIFEKLFKEFGINYTTTNQESVKKLLAKMTQDEVVRYLKETYEAISKTASVKNIAALFSMKIKKGERQIIKTVVPKVADEVPKEEKIKEKIKKITNYWLDYYNVCKNYEAAVNGLMSDLSEYIEEYPGLCEEYYNKFDKQVNKIKEKKGA